MYVVVEPDPEGDDGEDLQKGGHAGHHPVLAGGEVGSLCTEMVFTLIKQSEVSVD